MHVSPSMLGPPPRPWLEHAERSAIVGREHELEALARWLAGPAPALVEIEGEAGIGKTTLWEEGLRLARDSGATVLACRPAEVESPISYGGLAGLLESVLSAVADDIPPPRRRALEAALRLRDLPASSLDETAVALGALSAVRAAAARQQVVIAVDDVQWLDASSRVVLTYALRNLSDGDRVHALFATRAGAGSGPLDLGGSALARSRERLSLTSLSVGAVHRVVHRLLGAALSRPRVVRLHAASGGNPLHAIELARVVATASSPEPALDVPASLADVLRARLAPLSAPTRRLLVAVAAAGDVLPELLRRLATDAAVDEATESGILVCADGRVRFSHPLLASTIYADAGALVRSRVHRQLAGLAETAEERARHLALGGSDPDEAVAGELERAAASACSRGARAAGAALYEQAAELTPIADEHARDARLVAAARAHFQAGEPAGARALLEAVAAGRTALRFEACCLLGTLLDETVGGDASFAWFQAALGTDDPAVASDAHRGLAQSLAYVGDLERAMSNADAAVLAAEPLGDEARLAYALAMQAFVRRFAGHRSWHEPLERALALEAQLELPSLDACPSAVAADLGRVDLELDEARAAYAAMLGRSTDRGDVPTEAWCRYGLAAVELGAGDWDRAQEHAQELADLAEQTALLRLPSLRTAAHLATLRGDVPRARTLLDTVVDEAAARGELHNLRAARQVEALLELSLGDAAAAVAALEHARSLAEQMSVGEPGMLAFLVDLAEAHAALGDVDRATEALDAFERWGAPAPPPWLGPLAGRARGVVLAAAGDLTSARTALEAAVAAEDLLPLQLERARTRLVLGRLLRRTQHRAAAHAMLEDARTRFEALGAVLWAERAREELGRIGGRPRSVDELTPTEQRIAELVSGGLTNREVAAALFVTPKTVESALTRVYRKLGVRSRTELARRGAATA